MQILDYNNTNNIKQLPMDSFEYFYRATIVEGTSIICNRMMIFKNASFDFVGEIISYSYENREDTVNDIELELISNDALELYKKFDVVNEKIKIQNPKGQEKLIINQIESFYIDEDLWRIDAIKKILKEYIKFMKMEGKDILILDVDQILEEYLVLNKVEMINLLVEVGYLTNVVNNGVTNLTIAINELNW